MMESASPPQAQTTRSCFGTPHTGQAISRWSHWGPVNSIAFQPQGILLASGGADNTGKLWDSKTGIWLRDFPLESGIRAVAFSSDGKQLAIASEDGIVQIWFVQSGELKRTLVCLEFVTSVSFSPDGLYLATAGADKTARIWNIHTGEERISLVGHTDIIWSVAFSPDGRFLATSSSDQTIRLYALDIDELLKLARSRVTRTLTEQERRRSLEIVESPPDEQARAAEIG